MPEASIETQVEENPGRFIHTLRDKQVIIDSDLALLYEVETKYLNRVASRHVDRFPDDFRFQLSKDEYENLRCQIVTSSDNQSGHGGRRYMPYAYTEQGVAMLSGLLNSPKAVQVSVGVMRAFVEMRKFIANNAALLDRMATIEYRQLEYQQSTDERFDKVFGYLDAHTLPSEKIFFRGEMVDAFTLLVNLARTAKSRVSLIDGYVDEKTLNILAKKQRGVECQITTYPSAPLTVSDISTFESQHGPLQVRRNNDFHDRFLIIDDETVYHIGASIKDAGKKTFAMTTLNDGELKSTLLTKLREIFQVN